MDYERAKSLAVYYLSIKARTEKEIHKKLADKGASEDICLQTIEFLKEYRYIDDEDYIKRYMVDAINLKKHGIRRIRTDLALKGIDRELLENTLETIECDFESGIYSLIKQRADKMDLNDPKQKNRLVGFLIRRGYTYDEIFSAINQHMEENNV